MGFSINETLLKKWIQNDIEDTNTEILIKYWIQFKDYLGKGINACSRLVKVSVDYEYNNKLYKKSFIIKVPKECRNYSFLANLGIYSKESLMYGKILPQITKLLNFSVSPKHYDTIKSEILVFEDLVKLDYTISHQSLMNFKQCAVVFETLGKFHAASYKLLEDNPELISEIPDQTEIMFTKIEHNIKVFYPAFEDILKKEGFSEDSINKFRKYENEILKKSIYYTGGRSLNFKVLNHGNIQSDNIFLKYDEDEIKESKFVDYQTCHWFSPLTELIYFATFSMEFDVFKNNLEELIGIYLRTLNDTLERLGCSIRYTKKELDDDLESLKLYRIYAFIWTAFFNMRRITNNFKWAEFVLNSKDVEIIREHDLFKRIFSLFKYYERNGVFY
ncbi:hypothetical protein PGB90_004375 [Kerria lacca]